jgi:phenylalanyl-tRNA synthetase beta chain
VRRAIELIIAVAGGAEAEPALDLWPEPVQPRTVFLRPTRVAHLLGVEVPRAEIEKLLSGVGFTVAPKDDRLAIQVPGWRPDVTREVDLIGVARLRSYDVPGRAAALPTHAGAERAVPGVAAAVGALLTGLGVPRGPDPSANRGGDDAPVIVNPLSAEESRLQPRVRPPRAVEYNWSVQQRDVRLFRDRPGVSRQCSVPAERSASRWCSPARSPIGRLPRRPDLDCGTQRYVW